MWFKPWLSTKEREELTALREEKIKNEQEKWQKIEEATEVWKDSWSKPVLEKYYSKLFLVNDILTIVFNDGNVISKTGIGVDVVENIKNALSEKEIISLLSYKEPVKNDSPIEKKNLSILDDRFVVEGERVFLKGVGLQIPNIIVENFIEILEKLDKEFTADDSIEWDELQDRFNRLKFFWLKLATSSVEKCRESILRFCKDNDVRISKRGNLISYRRIVKIDGINSILDEFVKEKYEQIKKWKKAPSNYNVHDFKEAGYAIMPLANNSHKGTEDVSFVGNLADLKAAQYEEKEQYYTSWHNSGKYKFKIGDVYSLGDGEEPDDNLGNCSSNGIHGAACSWDYSGFGDTPVVVLVNPAKAIFVPASNSGKFRTQEMKIACINPNETGVHIDEDLIESADEEYNTHTIEELEEILLTKNFSNLSVGNNIPEISLPDLKSITGILKERVVNI